jgi:hypothetical protein
MKGKMEMTTIEYVRDTDGKVTARKAPLYLALASTLQAYQNCEKSDNIDWLYRHGETIDRLCRDYLPSGAGIDGGTHFSREQSTTRKLVFTTAFRHMNDAGRYDGWTDHTVTVTPAFDGIDIAIGGKDRNGIKDYIYDVFQTALEQIVEY